MWEARWNTVVVHLLNGNVASSAMDEAALPLPCFVMDFRKEGFSDGVFWPLWHLGREREGNGLKSNGH